MKTVSEMMVRSLGLRALGAPAKEAGTCVLCAAEFAVGDLVSKATYSSSFTDGPSLYKSASSDYFCGCCAAVSPSEVFRAVQDVIVTDDGVFPIGKKENRAWFLLNPPKPPFAVMYSTSNSQHTWWKVPITLDADHWYVQLGPRTIVLNRGLALRARDAAKRVMGALNRGKSTCLSPFLELDPWQTGSVANGALRPDVRRFCNANGFEPELRLFDSVGRGELWALSTLIYHTHDAAPSDPIDLNERKLSKQKQNASNV